MYLYTKDTRSIIISVMALSGIGVLMVYSSTALMSMREFGGSFHYLFKHFFTVIAGMTTMAVLANTDYQRIRPMIYILLGVSLLLLILVFLPGIGVTANGARRWLRLWPTTFQPSELVKIVVVIFLADYMDKNINRMKDFRYGILIPAGVTIGFQSIIIVQPDFGAVMSLGILTLVLLVLGGARLKHIGMLILISMPAIYVLITSSAYRMKRIMSFVDPFKDPFDSGFQLVQSLIAFGSGSFFGVGLGGSKQKLHFLPEVHTDFIFSLIGEELGLFGVISVLGLFLWLFIQGIRVSRRTCDPFSYFLTMGLTMMIGIQAIINIAVTTGLMPTKGLPLPFISYGGSALLINMAAVGILINISIKNKKKISESAGHMNGLLDRSSLVRRRR
ncbi:MAG: putative lipid II flippase FtsW [Nitrospirota bacterium]